MSFACPDCLTPDSLDVTLSIALPPDSRSDEIVLQIVECSHCGFRGAAVYEESRRGALDSDAWDHTGYRLREGQWTPLIDTIRRCPNPRDERCRCAAHRALGRTEAGGRWQGLARFDPREAFRMRLPR